MSAESSGISSDRWQLVYQSRSGPPHIPWLVPDIIDHLQALAEDGVDAEVVDVRTLYPLDADTLVESAKKTGYAIIIDEGAARYGVTGELASVIQERAFDWLDGPVLRIGAADVPIPFSPVLELPTIPDVDGIIGAVRSLRG